MKTSVSSYSYEQLIRRGEMTQFDVIAKAADMGFDGLEFSGLSPRAGESETAYAAALAAESKRVGIPIVNYCTGADFLKAESPEAQIESLKKELDLAAILGVKTFRHDGTFGYKDGERSWRGFEKPGVETVALGCKAVTQYAKTLGIKTMVENHGQFMQESRRVELLINSVADDNFGQLVDIGNFMCADEPPELAVGRNAPYAFHVHIKDFHYKSGSEPDPGRGWFTTRASNRLRGAIVGHGVVPVRQCINILRQNGYDGYLSIEFEGIEDPVTALTIGLENLKSYML